MPPPGTFAMPKGDFGPKTCATDLKGSYTVEAAPCSCGDGSSSSTTCLQRQGEDKVIFLLGDSHALRLGPALKAATSTSIKYVAQYGAETSIVTPHFLAFLQGQLRGGDHVIYSKSLDQAAPTYRLQMDLRSLFGVVNSAGAKLVVVYDGAILHQNPALCLLRGLDCGISKQEVLQTPRRLVAQRFASLHHEVKVFDIAQLLCSETTCSMFLPGTTTQAYIDKEHINQYAAKFLAPALCSLLTS